MPTPEQRKRQPSYAWAPAPGDVVAECPDCGPYWFAEFEAPADAGPPRLREWHRDECHVWRDQQQL